MRKTGKTLRALALGVIAGLGLANAGCIKSIILNGTIDSTYKAGAVLQTLSDFEAARGAAYAGMVQAEGYHLLAPDNDTALLLLARGWAGVGFAFIEDDMELAEEKHGNDSEEYKYHKARARDAYERALFYGFELLNKRAEGFEQSKTNAEGLRAWLEENFTDAEDAELLFWLGQAWMSRVNVGKDDPSLVAELFVGVEFMRRSVALDETFNNAGGHNALGSYHARAKIGELDMAKEHFDKAIALTEGKILLPKVQYAARYQCLTGDKEGFKKTLQEVLDAGDLKPEARLLTVIAKRRAKRYIKPEWSMSRCGF